jgi:hypothetical protein
MNFKILGFVSVLFLIVGLVIGYSVKKPVIITNTVESKMIVKDTVIKVKKDTVKILVDKIKYFTKTDTVFVNNEPVVNESVKCISFPILLSDSSKISITQCSSEKFPENIDYDARYIDKRERIRIVETVRNDTIRLDAHVKRLGFTLGPSAGIGIDVNNIRQPVYFIGATLTYGWRF